MKGQGMKWDYDKQYWVKLGKDELRRLGETEKEPEVDKTDKEGNQTEIELERGNTIKQTTKGGG